MSIFFSPRLQYPSLPPVSLAAHFLLTVVQLATFIQFCSKLQLT